MPVFSVLSLNTFGIPFFISRPRIKRIAEILDRYAPSVLCLQEIQQNAYLSPLRHGLKGYTHFASFHNFIAPKGGLFTAARPDCRVKESVFYPFPNQGRPISIGFSDWALNKGVLKVSLEIGERTFVTLNTHLQANYLADWRNTNAQTRIQMDQVDYLAQLTNSQPIYAWVVVCGDFNFPRQAPAYQRMIERSGLTDVLLNDPRPTYQPFPLVSGKWRTSLDYILYRKPAGEALQVRADILPVERAGLRWGFQRFLTDHHALVIYFD